MPKQSPFAKIFRKLRDKRSKKPTEPQIATPSGAGLSATSDPRPRQAEPKPELSKPTAKSVPGLSAPTPPTPSQPQPQKAIPESQPPKPAPILAAASPGAASASTRTPVTDSPGGASASTRTPATSIPRAFELNSWEHNIIQYIFQLTLDKEAAKKSGYRRVWLKSLAKELETNGMKDPKLTCDLANRLLTARLRINPREKCNDPEYRPVIEALPIKETVFEYLVGCWKRLKPAKKALIKKKLAATENEAALSRLENLRDTVVYTVGCVLRNPGMYNQPPGKPVGATELVKMLYELSVPDPLLSGQVVPLVFSSLHASSDTWRSLLDPSDVAELLRDLVHQFERHDELDGVLGGVVTGLMFHPSILKSEVLDDGDYGWKGVLGGLELLVSFKSVAVMITRLPQWNPPKVTAANFETVSLLGPICRLGVSLTGWSGLHDISGANHSNVLATLKRLQSSLFKVFDAIVGASPEAKEAVLNYFARIISLNSRKDGTEASPKEVSSSNFMLNLQSVLYRFAEPFMDVGFSKMDKMDKIDPLYLTRSSRIDLKRERTIEATEGATQSGDLSGPPSNFSSEIFYLNIAMGHCGYSRIIRSYIYLTKPLEEIESRLDRTDDISWMTKPMHAWIWIAQNEKAKVQGRQLSFAVGLLDPELISSSISFTTFLSIWLTRQADPRGKHPHPPALIPLPKEVPTSFRVLPEYILDDIAENMLFAAQFAPDKFDRSESTSLMTFLLAFLNSPGYIQNPLLKLKFIEVLLVSINGLRVLRVGKKDKGILVDLLYSHPVALKHLVPTLINFYTESQDWQASTTPQITDKYVIARRELDHVLSTVWRNPTHRVAFRLQAMNVAKFVQFINVMFDDITSFVNDSVNILDQISVLEVDRVDQAHQGRLLQRRAVIHLVLGLSAFELLVDLTVDIKAPFIVPEVVDRLATMLDRSLRLLIEPRHDQLRTAEKLKPTVKLLLYRILQIYHHLGDQQEFVLSAASNGRRQANTLLVDQVCKFVFGDDTPEIVVQLRGFSEKVEAAKTKLSQEDGDKIGSNELGHVPKQFIDASTGTLMEDPVTLPLSRMVVDRATIESHLLSSAEDPFNYTPLSIEEVIPNPFLKGQIMTFLEKQRQTRVDVE